MVLSEKKSQLSFPKLDYPVTREDAPRTPLQWLKGKRIQDGAEGLWRVHEGLYDLTNFINEHPGGTDWINITRGTDITEAFETHHLGPKAELLLPNYFVRKARSPRNSPFLFKEDGFYKTLKGKVYRKLHETPSDVTKKSDTITDALLILVLGITPLTCWISIRHTILGITGVLISGYVLSSLTTCAHNYFHKRDSWRMYLFNLSGMSYTDWRISHALSHHLHTNTIQDIELSMLEPFLQYLPRHDKSIFAQLGAFYWPLIFPMATVVLMIKEFFVVLLDIEQKRSHVKLSNLVPLFLPIWMHTISNVSLLQTLYIWMCTMLVSSFLFTFYGLTAGHHDETNFFDGDIPRSEYLDWGLHQLDTMVERIEYSGHLFKSITRFGDHALHHLFPTLDHAYHMYLYPTLIEHCDKFEVELRKTNQNRAIWSQAKQLARRKPNDLRPRKIKNQ